ncbi:MAG: phosphate butyryltransferase [Desulfovibrio sp.]|nr:phosphate butyryltransferase [Desulfovibrio sp.]
MTFKTFEELIGQLRAGKDGVINRRIVAVVAADDAHTLEAVAHAAHEGIISPILIGDPARIEYELSLLPRPLHKYAVRPTATGSEAALEAARLARSGEAHIIMKGKLQTPELMKALLSSEAQFRTGSLISHLSIVEIPNYHKLVGITDVALTIAPTLEQKAGIIENAVKVFTRMGFDALKVAVLAASENVNPKMPETVDAAELKTMNKDGRISGCLVEGPLSYDLAVSREAAEIKGMDNPVCGDADILLVPSIAAGNILVKALRCSAGFSTAAIVTGGRVPLALPSRASDADNKFLPIAVAAAVS